MCERIETTRSRKSIETEISKLKRRIQQEEPQASEKDAVGEAYINKVELYKKTMETVRANKVALKVREYFHTTMSMGIYIHSTLMNIVYVYSVQCCMCRLQD